MRKFILALVAVTTMALPVGAVKAEPAQAVATPMPGATGTAAPSPSAKRHVVKCPRQESSLVFDLRGVACKSLTLRRRIFPAPRRGIEPRPAVSRTAMLVRHTKRKAWDLNPQAREGARFSKPARPTVSGYLPSRRSAKEWTAGESNPDFLLARQVSSRWTSSP